MSPIRILITIGLVCLMACKTPSGLQKNALNPQLVAKIDQLIPENELPGLSFSVVFANGQEQHYSSGFADVEAKQSLNKDHSFFSGSIGKTYAVAVLMQLVEQNKVDLKEKLRHYFPQTDWLLQLPNIQDITIEMLLQHTSGLPRYVLKAEVWKVLHEQPNKVWTYQERLSYVFGDEPVHEAGKSWAYSDTNYIILGMLIEKISGSDYYDLVRSKILEPYKLKQTYPAIGRSIPNLASGYSKLPASFKIPSKVVENGQYIFNPQLEWTGGGMCSSAADLARWAKIYYEAQLFSKELLQQITSVNPNGANLPGGFSYGMGSFIFDTKVGPAFGHSGFMPGYNSIFAYYPEHQLAVALQINCDYASSKMQLQEYLDVLVPYLIQK